MATCWMDLAEMRSALADRAGLSGVSLLSVCGGAWCETSDPAAATDSLSQPRGPQSPKGFFLPPVESMGRYGAAMPAGSATQTAVRTVELVGVRACELRARDYLDQVFQAGEFIDSRYAARRTGATVISCDCVDCADSCFCTAVGGQPFATEGFDVNLTPVDGGYVVEAATERGAQWLGDADRAEATAEQLAERDRVRSAMVDRLTALNAEIGLSASDEAAPALPDDADPSWQRFAADCVECGACTHICPTCHCFYLYDQVLGPAEFERVRTWDSCLLSTYGRMAGAAGTKLTPRPLLSSRLANRVLHKFSYSPQQYDRLGCVGCGRCVDACIGGIDIREVVKELGQ